ncbi:MAG: ribbon-helix-helix protein, CopG family [Candidatus Eisenbacteria bacterium]|nr:ribbon-helix-helix protein, CopG family [Candidatus Eisenbacteria bacterium]
MTPGKSRADEYAQRVNEALKLLETGTSSTEVAQELAERHGVSVRQGWRYVREATERSVPLDVPEQKVVFTVKLPESLAERVRAVAAARGKTLSGLVSEALEAWLRRLRSGRQSGGRQKG